MKENITKLMALWRQVRQLRIPLHAANTGYFLILSVFPALVLLLSLLRSTALDVHSLLAFLEGFIPQALLPEAELLIIDVYEETSGAWLGISALTALWSSSRGMYGLLTGLNAIYHVPESRGYFRTRLLCVGYTFGFLLVLLLTLTLHIFGTELLELLRRSSHPAVAFLLSVIDFRFFLLLILQTVLFATVYAVLPNRKNSLRESLPGALLTAAGWLIFSDLFSVYVEHFPNYANIFGSVYAAALAMLWLYFCVCIIFYGGALNRYLRER